MKSLVLFLSIFFAVSVTAFSQCSMTIDHNNLSCYSDCNGWASVTPVSGVPPFTFLWSNNMTGPSINYVCSGFYSVTMTDSAGCVVSDTFTIATPPMFYLITDSVKDVTCYGADNGEAWIHATGGVPPYTYNWGSGNNDTYASGLAPNIYYPDVTDSNGCWTNNMVIVNGPSQITWTEVINDTWCVNTVGSIDITPSGGTPFSGANPYLFQWSNGYTTSNINFLAPGIYTVTITDSLGCSVNKDYILNDNSFVPFINGYTDVSCHGMNDGTVSMVNVTGGTPPYSYTWSNGALTDTLSNLSPGTYYLTVTDINYPTSCGSFAMVTILEPDTLKSSSSVFNPICYGDTTGYIGLFVTGGTPGQTGNAYNYSWSNGDSTDFISYVMAGVYSVTVTDSKNCIYSETFNITSPPQLVLDSFIITNVTCFQMNDASITFYMSGGVQPYEFSIGGGVFDTSNHIAWLLPDTLYSFFIQDANFCKIPNVDTSFTQPPDISLPYLQTDPSCLGNDGSIDITPSGGTPPFTIVWDTPPLSGFTVNGLIQGDYYATVTDNHGCENVLYFPLVQISAPAVLTGVNMYYGLNLPPDEAVIYLFTPSFTGAAQMDTIAETTNSASVWQFSGLMPGNYYLKANLVNPSSYPNLLNSYYDSTFIWQNALPIVLACNDSVNIVFNMYEMNPITTGNGSVSGNVIMVNGAKSIGEPVPGAEILIEQEPNDIPVQCAITDSSGNYSFTGLIPGSGYHLLVDIPGYPLISTYQNITISAFDSIPNLNFLVDSTSGGGIYIDTMTLVSLIPDKGISVEVFPNPFSSIINVKLSLIQSNDVIIELLDVTGKKLQILNTGELSAGKHEFTISPDIKTNGSAYLVIHTGNNILIKKLVSSPK